MKLGIGWIGIVLAALAAGVACAQQGDVRRVHDPCIIAVDGAYYLYCTGGGIAARRSKDLVRWDRAGTVFREIPAWISQEVPGVRGLWAPDISFFNGRYHLYYAASTFGSNRSCIGLATNVTLDPESPEYRWVDEGKVIETTRRDNWNAIDANIVFDEQRRPWMALGSFWSGIKLVRIDEKTGKPESGGKMHALAERPRPGAIEAPFMIRREGHYYLFVSFDYCARGVDSTYRIMVGRSKEITGPFVDREGKAMLEGGGMEVLATKGDVRGPGHNAILEEKGRHWLVHHFYDAKARGVPTLQIRPLTWDESGWPVAGEALAEADGGLRAAPATRAATDEGMLKAGDHVRRMEVDGRSRSYLVHVPPKFDARRPTPVVLIFHGAMMNAQTMVHFCGMNEKADKAGFVAVYPNGTGIGEAVLTFNAWAVPTPGPNGRPDDVAFTARMLDDLATVMDVDEKRVYATGLSNGGFMCHRLAAELSGRIAAIAPVAGTLGIAECRPTRPVPVMHFHGTADTIVPFGGGGQRNRPAVVLMRSVEDTIGTWVKLNGCAEEPKITDMPDVSDDGTRVRRKAYGQGKEGAEVVLFEIEGGGHTWPGQEPRVGFIGRSTKDISANELMWEFFERHEMK